MAQVSVVIVTWNSVKVISDCLKSVESQTIPLKEIVVVDNASVDGTWELIGRAFPHVRAIRNGQNLGFSRGSNQGIEQTSGEFLLLLNPDVTLSSAYVELLCESVKADPTAGSAGGKLYLSGGEPKSIDSAGIVLDKARWHPHDRGHGLLDNGQFNDKEEVFGVTAAAALYRRRMLEDCHIDGEVFDEDFFAYYEDVDLAWRARLFGWRALYVPEAVAFHPRRGPVAGHREVDILSNRNRYLLFLKNDPRATFTQKLAPMVVYELGRCAKRLLTRPSLLMAIPKALALVPRTLKKRRQVQQRATADLQDLARFY